MSEFDENEFTANHCTDSVGVIKGINTTSKLSFDTSKNAFVDATAITFIN